MMWSGVRKALWGHKEADGLKIKQLNGESGEEYVTEARQSRRSQDEWDVAENRFEDLDSKIQKRREKTEPFSADKLRSPSLMFWRQTEEGAAPDCARSSEQPKLSACSCQEISLRTSSGPRGAEGIDDLVTTPLSCEALQQSEQSPTDHVALPLRKSSSIISWLPSGEHSMDAGEGGEGTLSVSPVIAGKKKLRRKSSLLRKLRDSLGANLEDIDQQKERSGDCTDEDANDEDKLYGQRLSTFLQKFSMTSSAMEGTESPYGTGGGSQCKDVEVEQERRPEEDFTSS